jgi:DNA-directed RNA polymerase specialized sigma24 family protein
VSHRPIPDVGTFEALFASHGARMKSLALNLLGNRADAENAVQEASVRAYQQRAGSAAMRRRSPGSAASC